MAKLLTGIEHITRSKPYRVDWYSRGRHLFGGEPKIRYSGIAFTEPIQHFLTIDTNDPHTPIVFEGTRYVPLIYPMNYGGGGGEIAYKVLGDHSIEITQLTPFDAEDDSYFPDRSLPQKNAILKSLSYPERRVLESDIPKLSYLDRKRVRRLWNSECFRVSGILEYEKDLGNLPCEADKSDQPKNCSGWRFAYFPASQVPFGDIWHEYTSDVWICFAICKACGTIFGYNTCT